MNGVVSIFESNRCRLLGTAYRMLKTRADAEDVLQEAYLRWHEVADEHIKSPTGFLITVTTRLCLDRIRRLKREQEKAPETGEVELDTDAYATSPEEQREVAENLSVAFLAVLERLSPDERAAFLLREVFDYDYSEVARTVCKSESACRQLIHRARTHLRDGRARFAIEKNCRERLFERFLAATTTGDHVTVCALLSEEIQYTDRGE